MRFLTQRVNPKANKKEFRSSARYKVNDKPKNLKVLQLLEDARATITNSQLKGLKFDCILEEN